MGSETIGGKDKIRMSLKPFEVYNALKNENRVETLRLVGEGKSLTEIADELDMSNSGVHSYLKDFEEVNLVQSENQSRRITEVGEVVLDHTDKLAVEIEEAEKEMVSRRLKDTAEDLGVSDLSEDDLEKLL